MKHLVRKLSRSMRQNTTTILAIDMISFIFLIFFHVK